MMEQRTVPHTVKKIQELIDNNLGDTGRLNHIIDFINNEKPLYKTDRIYLETKLNSKITIIQKKEVPRKDTTQQQIKKLIELRKGDPGRLEHILDMLRKEIRPQLDPLDPMLSPNQEAAADDIYGSNQEAMKISKAIEQLPTDQAVLIKMTYYEDKSHSIIADELKMPLGTVKSRIRLASTRLRKLLEGKIYD